ncbi:hypothetical protein PL498_23185 [Bacteroides xylanisolvens]|uniref:hypothetical protein n=1 Tax=Bacteroides xylanisolvens TaxID=371601 RepID=UPI00230751ED|nr:hypothetical protein [Bacteroides xylanisolvens]MDB0718151.1 hypothetical protein [Bacteroides xylanisolvens]MDB0738886.1 hypothetical protein [Bacteroides xylanisolvens]
MKQKLLTDIELDVHELKYLMDSFTKEPTPTLSELLKRSITRMQGRLDELQQEVDAVQVTSESVVVKEDEEGEIIVAEEKPVVVVTEEGKKEEPAIVEESVAETVVKEEEPKSVVLGESLKLSAGLRHAISLNDSFRFSRELFGGDTELMNRVIEQISVMGSYKTAVAFLSSKVEINEEKEAVNDFLELLKKFFNQSA